MYFVGIDGGGTKCEIIVCDENANIVGYELSSASDKSLEETQNINNSGGYGRNVNVVKVAFYKAIEKLDNSSLFIINTNVGSVKKTTFKDINYELNYISEHLCYKYATNIDKVYLVLSGTGAFVTYYNNGEELYFDGLGPGLGDYGGGYEIGLQGIKAASLSEWGPEYKTSLAKAINQKMINKEDNNYGKDLVWMFYKFKGRNDIASYSRIVNEEAEKGDQIAINILKEAGRSLGNTVRCLVNNVRPNNENFPLCCDGSVIRKSRIYREAFIEYCKEYVPNNKIIFSNIPQALGCIMAYISNNKSFDKNDFYNKLKENYKNFIE